MANIEDTSRAHQNNTFRKIELQSPADLSHLQTLSQRAARQKINVAFPPAAQEGGEDELRKRVEALVAAYVDQVFRGLKSNILVNGVEVTDSGDGRGGVREVTEGENGHAPELELVLLGKPLMMNRIRASRHTACGADTTPRGAEGEAHRKSCRPQKSRT